MVERLSKRGVIIPSLVFILIATLISCKEIPILKGEAFFLGYLWGKVIAIGLFLSCILLAIFEVEFIFTQYPILFILISIFYECHGQLFQPNYWLAYIQITQLFPFIFYLDKRLLGTLLTVKLLCFDITFLFSAQKFISQGIFSREFSSDILSGTIISTIIAYIGASVFFTEKMKRHQIYQRFIDLGKNLSSIIHDIKGMISGPCTYIDILYPKMAGGSFSEEDLQIGTYLKEDIYAVKDFVMEMNYLVSSQITEKENPVRISTVIISIKKVFKSKIKNIQIELIGDMTLKTRIDHLNRILTNSIINSCEAIHKNNAKNGKVTIYCENFLLGIADNSGEHLNKQTLKLLNNPHVSFTNKDTGSGIGLLLIKDYIGAIGGKFRYFNQINGVSLEIKIPKRIILKTSTPEERYDRHGEKIH